MQDAPALSCSPRACSWLLHHVLPAVCQHTAGLCHAHLAPTGDKLLRAMTKGPTRAAGGRQGSWQRGPCEHARAAAADLAPAAGLTGDRCTDPAGSCQG